MRLLAASLCVVAFLTAGCATVVEREPVPSATVVTTPSGTVVTTTPVPYCAGAYARTTGTNFGTCPK